MFSRGGFDAKSPRRKHCGVTKPVAPFVALGQDQPDKTLILEYIAQLVIDGYAEWVVLDSREVEVRFTTGEICLFSKTNILRLA